MREFTPARPLSAPAAHSPAPSAWTKAPTPGMAMAAEEAPPALGRSSARSHDRRLDEHSPAEQEANAIGQRIRASGGAHSDIPAVTQRISDGDVPTPALDTRLQRVSQHGRPLNEPDRVYFELRFGHDLSRIRIHDDSEAGALARGMGTQAFAFGHDIVIDTRPPVGHTLSGRAVLAHEIVHVVQQGGAPRLDGRSAAASDAGDRSTVTPRIAAKVTVTEEMWRSRFEIEIKKYRLAMASPDIAVRRWSLKEAIKETDAHLGTAKGTFQPAQEYIDKAEGVRPERAEPDDLSEAVGKLYVDAFDSWDYDVNYDIVKTGGSEWTGASPWLTLHFGGTTINVDMRQITERTLSSDEVKAAFEKRYVRGGVTFPEVLSPSTAMNVVAAMEAAREDRDAAFAFTNSLTLAGLGAFFMTWPGLAVAGRPGRAAA